MNSRLTPGEVIAGDILEVSQNGFVTRMEVERVLSPGAILDSSGRMQILGDSHTIRRVGRIGSSRAAPISA